MRRFAHPPRRLVGPLLFSCLALMLAGDPARGQPATAPAAGDKIGKLPGVEFNVPRRQVRVACEALAVDAPLEFFLCRAGTAEHESLLRTEAKPSDVHTALLAIGVKPGEPLTYLEKAEKWLAPHGPPLHVTVEFQDAAGTVATYPAYRWLQDVKTKRAPGAFTWVFTGSRVMKDGRYAADDTGYMITLVNFDFAMIDVPDLASADNAQLEWERNAKLMPPKGTKVWVVLEPAGKGDPIGGAGSATRPAVAGGGGKNPTGIPPAAPVPAPATGGRPTTLPAAAALPDPAADEARTQAYIDSILKRHRELIAPRAQALREAAQSHYAVVAALRAEQQRLITKADLIQRQIDELEKTYTDMTAPRPEREEAAGTPPPPADVPQ